MDKKREQNNKVAAVRRLLGNPKLKVGRRGDFALNGKRYIVQAINGAENKNMDYRAPYRGFDYTLNIKFEKNGLRANVIAHN